MGDTPDFPWRRTDNDNDDNDTDDGLSRLDTSITDDPVRNDTLDAEAWRSSGE